MSSAGTCYLTLNLPEASRKAIGETIRLSEANEVREQSLYLTALAGTYLPECEIEEACRCAHQALVIAEETISNRAVRRVRQLRGRLEAWRDEQCVRDLDEQLLRFIV